MAKLRIEQIEFLLAHGLTPEDLFDGLDMSQREREAAMEASGKRFYFNGAPCGAAKHTLRSKRGQCIQCKPAEIAYAMRYSKPAKLCVAGSLRGELTKIGVAADLDDRLRKLRFDSYGGFGDWSFVAFTPCIDGAGRLEADIQKQLAAYSVEGSYDKGGRRQKARELFSCNCATAVQTLIDLLPAGVSLEWLCSFEQLKSYEWRRAA